VPERPEPRDLKRTIRAYLTSQQQASDLSRRTQEHEDTTLTWALALMGGALLALPSTLEALHLHVEWTRRGYLLACTPWVFGSISAVFGRFFYRWLQIARDDYTLQRTTYLNRILLNPATAKHGLSDILTNQAGDLQALWDAINKGATWTTRFFYLTHGLLVVGFVSMAVFILCRTFIR
jgi:hypothetical protein